MEALLASLAGPGRGAGDAGSGTAGIGKAAHMPPGSLQGNRPVALREAPAALPTAAAVHAATTGIATQQSQQQQQQQQKQKQQPRFARSAATAAAPPTPGSGPTAAPHCVGRELSLMFSVSPAGATPRVLEGSVVITSARPYFTAVERVGLRLCSLVSSHLRVHADCPAEGVAAGGSLTCTWRIELPRPPLVGSSLSEYTGILGWVCQLAAAGRRPPGWEGSARNAPPLDCKCGPHGRWTADAPPTHHTRT
jgi:hypothetical protein